MTEEQKKRLPVSATETVVESVSLGRHKFSKENAVLEGEYVRTELKRRNIFSKRFPVYFFNTVEGETSCTLGVMGDSQIGKKLIPGQFYRITFRGQRQMPNGHKMNDYRLERFIMLDGQSERSQNGDDESQKTV